MSLGELSRLKTVQAVIDGNIKPGRAAERLGISDRQLRRLVARHQLEGPAGLRSKRFGRPSNYQLPDKVTQDAIGIIRELYPDFGPTLACEKLLEVHHLKLAKETVRRLMVDAGLWVPRKQRPPKIYQPRHRRPCVGELIQIDGSDHDWFEGRAPNCTLLVYVDDATSRIMQLLFTKSESTFSYYQATRAYLEKHGKPIALYSDKASVFRINKKQANGGDGHTQFARALFDLNIDGICANSSQAKGRVERAHQTLQDRLVKELRLRKISSIEDANAYAQEFVDDYNKRFSKPPKNAHNAHRPVRDDEDLNLIFTWREPRCVSKSLTVQYDKRLLMLQDTAQNRKLASRYIEVYHYPDGSIELRANGKSLPYSVYDRLPEVQEGAIVDNKRLGHALEIAKLMQDKRDNRRSQSVPADGISNRSRGRPPGKKSQRALSQEDLNEAMALAVNSLGKHHASMTTHLGA